LAATFVDINNLEMSSGLGRVIGEQLGSKFAQQGFTVIELKMRSNIFVKEGAGEFALSRSIKEISQSHNAAAVIAGTYAVARQSVFIQARLIRATDNLILASYDYSHIGFLRLQPAARSGRQGVAGRAIVARLSRRPSGVHPAFSSKALSPCVKKGLLVLLLKSVGY